jgi:O-antigen ligase
MLLFYLMLLNTPIHRSQIAWSLGAAMVVQAAFSVPQFLLGHTAGLHQLGEIPNDSRWPGASVVALGERRWLRAYGLTPHPNVLGGLAMTSLLVMAGFYLRQAGLRRLVLLGLMAVSLGTLLLTFSRSAWVGTLAGFMVLLALLLWGHRAGAAPVRRSSLLLLAAALLAVVLTFASLVWPLLVPRLGLASEGVEIRSVEERLLLGEAALGLIRLRPWLGVGLGGFSAALYRLTPEAVSYYEEFTPVHNIMVLATAELGILGGLLWLFLIVSPWLALWLRRRQVVMTPWWAGLCAGLVALTVAGFFDHYPWSLQQGRLVLWLVWGLWAREWTRSLSPAE